LPGELSSPHHHHPEILDNVKHDNNNALPKELVIRFLHLYLPDNDDNVSHNPQEDLAKIAQEKGPHGVVTEDDIAGIMGKLRR
jgi:hypothetical protein